MKSRVSVLGLLAVGVVWGCGGTATHGDPQASETDAGGSSDGFGGDFGDGPVGGSGGSGASASDSSGGSSTVDAGGGPTTRGNDSGSAATTRGNSTNGDSTSGDSTSGDSTNGDSTTSGQNDTSTSATSSNSGNAVTNGAGGMVGTADSVGTTANTTVSTSGNGGFGGDPSTSTATFSSSSVATSTTGTGGTEPDPELDDFPYLEDCEDNYWTVGPDYCSLGFSCSEQTGYASCWEVGNGEFSCDCSHYYFWSNYWLYGANVEDACAYAASACVAGPDAEHAQPVCTPSYLYQGTTYCSANATCRTSVDIEGADLERTGNNYVSCEERDDSWVCSCTTTEGQVTVTLSSEDGSADMCVDALDWCGGEITREGPRSCRPTSQNAETNYCYANLVCTQGAVVGGAPATLSESFSLTCEHDASDAWVCDCPGAGSFEVEAETAWDACTLGASECTPE